MNHSLSHLTPTEADVLRAISIGESIDLVTAKLGISRESFHVHTSSIRSKTGIKDTADAHECREYVRACRRAHYDKQHQQAAEAAITQKQLSVFLHLMQGLSYPQIAAVMRIRSQSVQNYATCACQRLALTGKGSKRTAAIREWLEKNGHIAPAVSPDPFDDPAFQ